VSEEEEEKVDREREKKNPTSKKKSQNSSYLRRVHQPQQHQRPHAQPRRHQVADRARQPQGLPFPDEVVVQQQVRRDRVVHDPDDRDRQRRHHRGARGCLVEPEDQSTGQGHKGGRGHPEVAHRLGAESVGSFQRGLEGDRPPERAPERAPAGLDEGPPQDRVGDVGEPERLEVAEAVHIVHHAELRGHVDREAEGGPPGHHDGEDAAPDRHQRDDDEGRRRDGADDVGPDSSAVHEALEEGEAWRGEMVGWRVRLGE
jgi:hypothetical protein